MDRERYRDPAPWFSLEPTHGPGRTRDEDLPPEPARGVRPIEIAIGAGLLLVCLTGLVVHLA